MNILSKISQTKGQLLYNFTYMRISLFGQTQQTESRTTSLQDVIKAFNNTVLNFYFKKEPKFNELSIQPKKQNKTTNKNSKRNPK